MIEQTTHLAAETARLQLRPVRPGGEAAVYAPLSDERVVRTTQFAVFAGEQQARDLIVRVQQQQLAAPQPAQLAFTIAERAGADLVGVCGLVFKPELRDAEVWYLLRPDRWGHGLVSESHVPTRERPALLARMRDRMRQRREDDPHVVSENNRRQPNRARRVKSQILKRVARLEA